MTCASKAIGRLVALARANGLDSDDGPWSEMFVHWFKVPMPDSVREAGLDNPHLEYLSRLSEPWTAAHEGFFDRANKVAAVFETGK